MNSGQQNYLIENICRPKNFNGECSEVDLCMARIALCEGDPELANKAAFDEAEQSIQVCWNIGQEFRS